VHWGFEETKVFLAILSESPFAEKLRTCHQNSQIYRAIAERLRALGFLRTLEQCRYRFKNLLRSYRKAKSSCPPGTCPFYEEMDSLMRARTVIRAVEMVGEATGLPGSGQSSTEADDQEAWGEMEDEDAVRLLTPDSQPADAGEAGAIGCWQNLQPCTKMGAERTRMGTGHTKTKFSAQRRFICPRGTEGRE
jgi:SCAN domain-containing zinc finger protein